MGQENILESILQELKCISKAIRELRETLTVAVEGRDSAAADRGVKQHDMNGNETISGDSVKSTYDRYRAALEHVRYEGQLLWQIFHAFLLAHTVFLSFLLNSAFRSESSGYQPAVFFPGLLGLFLCLPWFASYLRSSAYYKFRMAQAKETEPEDWNIIGGKGERFSRGLPVTIGDECYRIHWLGRILRTKRSVPALILAFALAYAGLVIWCGPWW